MIIGVVILGGIIWAYAQPNTGDSTPPDSRVISRYGIHWHSKLSINIKGENVPIPVNIGLGVTHNPIHTHDPDNVIHLEFDGRVTEKDTELKNFFDVWGKEFSKDSLLGNVAGAGGTITMLVNGEENTEFENYHMKDKDTIELKFE